MAVLIVGRSEAGQWPQMTHSSSMDRSLARRLATKPKFEVL
jgi:hypothetical protein